MYVWLAWTPINNPNKNVSHPIKSYRIPLNPVETPFSPIEPPWNRIEPLLNPIETLWSPIEFLWNHMGQRNPMEIRLVLVALGQGIGGSPQMVCGQSISPEAEK